MALDAHDDIAEGISQGEDDNLVGLLLWRQRNGIRDDEFLDRRLVDALDCRIGQDGMGAGSKDALRTALLKCAAAFAKRTGRINDIVDDDGVLPSTSPMRFMTSAQPGRGRRFSMMAIGACR